MKHHNRKINGVLEFNVDESVLEERIVGRRVHPASGRSYHVQFAPPKVEGIDDVTGEPLIQRNNDTSEALHKTVGEHHSNAAQIIGFYRERNLLHTINATQGIA